MAAAHYRQMVQVTPHREQPRNFKQCLQQTLTKATLFWQAMTSLGQIGTLNLLSDSSYT